MTSRLGFTAGVARVLIAGDWHGNTAYAMRVLRRLGPNVDVVLHLGDFGFTFTPGFLGGVSREAQDAGVEVLFLRGNHDNPDLLAALERDHQNLAWLTDQIAWIPDGTRWAWSGVRFLAVGGAHSIDRAWREPGVSWWAGETTPRALMQQIATAGPTDVLLTHDVPAGAGGLRIGAVPGFPQSDLDASAAYRADLADLAASVTPRHLWHGHHHRRYISQTHFGGQPCSVTGLGCDGMEFHLNTDVVDLADLLSQPR